MTPTDGEDGSDCSNAVTAAEGEEEAMGGGGEDGGGGARLLATEGTLDKFCMYFDLRSSMDLVFVHSLLMTHFFQML